ncbi:rhodanese-like domain-containing protein [Jatrophihabitans sp. YIM 134969]
MTRYVVIGAGAVGVTLAAQLRGAGRDVVVVGRGRQLDLLLAGELRYVTPDGSRELDVPAVRWPDELDLTVDDVLVLTTKTQDADAVIAEWAVRPVGDLGVSAGAVLPVVTLQNGLEAERTALRHAANVIGAVLWIPSTYVTDGEVVSPAAPTVGAFWLGDHPDGAPSEGTRTVAADLRAAGFAVQVVDDLSRWKAAKLVVSATFALDALFRPGPARDRAAGLVRREARAVLAAVGQDVADVETETTVDLTGFRVQPTVAGERPGSSSFQSLARGRRAETDHLNGEIVALARSVGRRAPVDAALQARVARASLEGTAPGSLDEADLARTLAGTVLADPRVLRAELRGSRPPTLLDVRWRLGETDGEKRYLDGHLPGAVYVDLETDLAAHPSQPTDGRHPLPSVDALQASVRRWGLRDGGAVVVYDDNGGQSAARAWWLLRWAGFDVRLLDGGLPAWTDAGGDLVTGAVTPEPGDALVRPGGLEVLDADTAATWPSLGVLLDARAGERYRGDVEPVDPRAGHIPGAVSLPTSGNLDATGRFLDVDALRARFADVVADGPVAVYCGSGVTAAHEIAALTAAGVDAALFAGSWSAWSSDPARPVAVGDRP